MSLAQIREEYARIRLDEQRALQERRQHAYTLHPGFAQIEEKRQTISATLVAAIRLREPANMAASNADDELRTLDQQERALLLSLGLSEDYLSVHARCAQCNDTGYVGETLRTPCACLQAALHTQQRASSQINNRETFETFDESIYPSQAQRKQMLHVRAIMEEFVSDMPETSMHSLLVRGAAGLGKTFLLNCIATRALERGIASHKVTAYSLMDKLLHGIRNSYDGAAEFMRVPLLIIDDIGTEPMLNNITCEYLFSILNERRNGNKHTVVATNLTLEKLLDRYGERVFSRLISTDDARILDLSGQNLRLVPRGAQHPPA